MNWLKRLFGKKKEQKLADAMPVGLIQFTPGKSPVKDNFIPKKLQSEFEKKRSEILKKENQNKLDSDSIKDINHNSIFYQPDSDLIWDKNQERTNETDFGVGSFGGGGASDTWDDAGSNSSDSGSSNDSE